MHWILCVCSVKAVTVSAPAKVPAGTELIVSSETATLHVVTETIEDAEVPFVACS